MMIGAKVLMLQQIKVGYPQLLGQFCVGWPQIAGQVILLQSKIVGGLIYMYDHQLNEKHLHACF